MGKDNSEERLAPYIRLVRLQAEAALVERMNAGYGFADTRIPAEIYLRDEGARDRMNRNSLRPKNAQHEQAEELARAIDHACDELATHDSELAELCRRFQLDEAECALLSIAIAYQVDADVRALCNALAWRRAAGLFGDVCQEIAPELEASSVLLRVLHPVGTLRRNHLIELARPPGERYTPALACPITVSARILDFLFGDTRLAAPLHTAMAVFPREYRFHVHIPDTVVERIELVCQHLDKARQSSTARSDAAVVLIQGPMGSGKRAVAHHLAVRLGRPLAAIGLGQIMDLTRREGDAGLMHKALAEATMRGAVAYVPGIDTLMKSADSPSADDQVQLAIDAIAQHHDLMILGTTERRMPTLPVRRPFHLIRLPTADLDIRQRAWRVGLEAISDVLDAGEIGPRTADDLAARYVIGPGTVGEVVADARAFARATGGPVKHASIEEAVGRRLSMRLGSFGTVISRRARMEEMVLPEDVLETLEDMIAMVRQRTQILERWGYSRHLGLSRGVSGLFSGEPGTGKTMAASVISSALGLELVRIDLSSVTSKWVGETEKHLAKIFDEAQTANAMLLFDEADSLFGKRTELKSAQDRYANLEVNYVLQRMENFDGVSVLTTNFESAIDPAFLRRLNFRVRFPKPEFEERVELWRRLLPPATGLCDQELGLEELAQRFVMTGGHIKNAIVRAAVVAARQGRMMTPDDLFTGALHEYAEMGKVMPSTVRGSSIR